MEEAEFDAIINKTRLNPTNREAARLHFVQNMKQIEVAAAVGISRQRMNQVVDTFEAAADKYRKEQANPQVEGKELVAVLDASFAMAVKSARQSLGDDVQIQSPKDGINAVGQVIARTDYHLVQSLGRDAVMVHDLAKLNRVPAIGKSVAIHYQEGKGVVADRDLTGERGGVTR